MQWRDLIKIILAVIAAIVLVRLTHTPLAALLPLVPYVLPYFKKKRVVSSLPPMSKKEAREILGVSEQATASDITEAHRRLIQKNHPDTGGTDYLATKINQARDILLGP